MREFLVTLTLLFTSTLAQATGFRFIDVPADGEGPALRGAIWSPCSKAPRAIDLGNTTVPGVKDCPIGGDSGGIAMALGSAVQTPAATSA